MAVESSNATEKYDPSKLDKATQFLVDLLFQTEMFNHALAELKLGLWFMFLYFELNDSH